MSLNKVTYTTEVDRPYIKKSYEVDQLQGRHKVGVVYGYESKDGDDKFETYSQGMTEEIVREMVEKGEMIEVRKTGHNDQVGLYEFKMYAVEYFDKECSICKPVNMEARYGKDMKVEIVVTFKDEATWSRVYYYEYDTVYYSPTTLRDLDFEEIFEEMLEDGKQGLKKDEYGLSATVYDELGMPSELDLDDIRSLVDGIISVRLI